MFVSLSNEVWWCYCSVVGLIKHKWWRNGKRKMFFMRTLDMYIEDSVKVLLSEMWQKLTEIAMGMNTVYIKTKARR